MGQCIVVMSWSLSTVVPLTTAHVSRVMAKTKSLHMLCSYLGIPENIWSNAASAASAAEYYVHHSTRPRIVRKMIYVLDNFMEETALADSVMECAEVCVCQVMYMYIYMYIVDCISEKELHINNVYTCTYIDPVAGY